jgi:hypothetical protein
MMPRHVSSSRSGEYGEAETGRRHLFLPATYNFVETAFFTLKIEIQTDTNY